MKVIKCLVLLFLSFSQLFLMSCSDDGKTSGSGGDKKLQGTKWILTNWDYSLGDEYIGLHDETYNFFFYSSTEGAFYYGRKDNYSDQGSSSQRVVCHFTYSVKGDEVHLEYITDKYLNTTLLQIQDNVLTAGQLKFSKGTISYTDTQWLNSVHGLSGSCSWYSDMNGKLWIDGEGAMANYSSYEATPWAKNNRTPNEVVIGEGVTAIGSYAFADVSIADVEMPDMSLRQVGEAAFKGSLIKTIWMSESTISIGKEAFAGCTELKDINIPESLESVGDYAFSGCTALNEYRMQFGENLKTVGEHAFEGGTSSYLTFAEGVQSIASGAFIGNYCGISRELVLPNSLTSIGATAFEGTYRKVVLGTGIAEIGDKAFISGVTSGSMYVNRAVPPSAGENIVVNRTTWGSAENNWTLYVPKGSRGAYMRKSPWNKFSSIVEDGSLLPGDGDVEDPDDDTLDYTSLTYEIDGNTYNMVLVEGGPNGDFYIMQTELLANSYLKVGGRYIGMLNKNGDGGIIKAELRQFLDDIRDITGIAFRLPTSAEWQYAAKGGNESSGYLYSGSNTLDDVAYYRGNSNGSPGDIATKRPNELGLYDMSGNYGELSNDMEDEYYIDGCIHGGCWNDAASSCKATSWKEGDRSATKIPGTNLKELNAVDAKYITVRLVYSVPE